MLWIRLCKNLWEKSGKSSNPFRHRCCEIVRRFSDHRYPSEKKFGKTAYLVAHARWTASDGLGRRCGCRTITRFVTRVGAGEHPNDHVQDQNRCKKQSHTPIIGLSESGLTFPGIQKSTGRNLCLLIEFLRVLRPLRQPSRRSGLQGVQRKR